MQIIQLDQFDLGLSAILVLLLAGLSRQLQLQVSRKILVAALRTFVQLSLVGLVLKTLFNSVDLLWVGMMALFMLLIAGREVRARQHRPIAGIWGYSVGTLSMFVSSFAITIIALQVMVRPTPWYTPQYAIPLLGMLLGNTMNGIAISLDRLSQAAWQQQDQIEARLLLGQPWQTAFQDIRREAMRSGMIPMINAMSSAGLVSLPGMMTGQILSGTAPVEAVKYQILVMFLITAGTGFGTLAAIWLAGRRLFDDRHRLRLDRLQQANT